MRARASRLADKLISGAWVTTIMSQRIGRPLVYLPLPVTFNLSQLAPGVRANGGSLLLDISLGLGRMHKVGRLACGAKGGCGFAPLLPTQDDTVRVKSRKGALLPFARNGWAGVAAQAETVFAVCAGSRSAGFKHSCGPSLFPLHVKGASAICRPLIAELGA